MGVGAIRVVVDPVRIFRCSRRGRDDQDDDRMMGKFLSYKERAIRAEGRVMLLAAQAKDAIGQLSARCSLFEAAMRVLLRHDLLREFSQEVNNPSDISGYASDRVFDGARPIKAERLEQLRETVKENLQ
jgi:hypothetical protein